MDFNFFRHNLIFFTSGIKQVKKMVKGKNGNETRGFVIV